MIAARHTPGPWAWDEYGSLAPVDKEPDHSAVHTIISPEGSYGYLASDLSETLAETERDKQLIAAAPDMLDALEHAQRELRRHRRPSLAAKVALAKVEAAIAKATGSDA